MKRFGITIITLAIAWSAQCQDYNPKQDILRWKYNEVLNGATSETVNLLGSFVVYPGNRIEWFQKEDEITETYDIESRDGTWNDTSEDGTIQFNVSVGSSSGTITFRRVNASFEAVMFLNNPGRQSTRFTFSISSVEQVN